MRNATSLLGLLWIIITATPLVRYAGSGLAGDWSEPRGEVLLVLGGSSLEDGTIGESSYWRAFHALLAYRGGGVRRIVLSGGGEPKPAAEAMRTFLEGSGVPAEVIEVEDQSRSTRENAVMSARLIRGTKGRVLLMTSDYHMFRARAALRKEGIAAFPCPVPDVIKRSYRWNTRWPAFLDLSSEVVKIVYYRARGWI